MKTKSGLRKYPVAQRNICVITNPVQVQIGPGNRVEVDGRLWSSSVTEVIEFREREFAWRRVFYDTKAGEKYSTRRASEVRVLRNAADGTSEPRSAAVLKYLHEVAAALPDSDPTRRAYEQLDFVHPDSVLARYLAGVPGGVTGSVWPGIAPFSSNLSQQDAVAMAIQQQVSVIDGPPGTGKTQAILNLVANLIDTPGSTVGVVSFSNAAVDNVREKLQQNGYGFVVAGLGNSLKKEDFFNADRQRGRSAHIESFMKGTAAGPSPSTSQIAQATIRLRELLEAERRLERLHSELDAYRLEQHHFHLAERIGQLPALRDVPLLSKSSDQILDYLAETALVSMDTNTLTALVGRVRRYFKYGRTRGISPDDTDVVLRLHEAFYARKIEEIEGEVGRLEKSLADANFAELIAVQKDLSVAYLNTSLRQRYAHQTRTVYDPRTYRNDSKFFEDYPVVLSTCHSLESSLPSGKLLDYVVIDESSQVNLLAASLVLASARNVVVVGDLRQLPQISDTDAAEVAGPAPAEAYDYANHSILSSILALYGPSQPRVMLREHYRCDPAIIGFCNAKFYDGQLIPFTAGRRGSLAQPLVVVRTAEGNHMRRHSTKGRFNQREADVIVQEVIERYCSTLDKDRYGVVTPFRNQANTIQDMLSEDVQSDTAHGYQGREKDVMIMSTVLDESRDGHFGITFADNPQLVNVVVSRAVKQLIVVTDNHMLPRSRNLRDLIGYIRYHNPEWDVVDSSVISVFDLLYREYSARLRPLKARVKSETRYYSEDIIWEVLRELLASDAPRYGGLRFVHDVLLKSLLHADAPLNDEQAAYVQHRASVDFVIYNSVTRRPVLAVEVDGFKFHANNPAQLRRDALKDQIFHNCGLPLLRLPTTGSDERTRIQELLNSILTAGEDAPAFASVRGDSK